MKKGKSFFRIILKVILEYLAKLTIRKHKIRFVVIVGWYGTEIIREQTYEILNTHISCRRNTHDIWWDLSLPNIILGYADTQRSVVQWLLLIFSTLVALLKNRFNPHIIILDLNLGAPDIVNYWSKIVTPEILIIVNKDRKINNLAEKLELKTLSAKGQVLKYFKEIKTGDRGFSYILDNKIRKVITHRNVYNFGFQMSRLEIELVAPAIAASEAFGITKSDIIAELDKINTLENIASAIKRNKERLFFEEKQ